MTPRDTAFAICGVCGGEHDNGFGYTPGGMNAELPIMWTCDACLPVAAQVYGVAMQDSRSRRRYELQARDDALAAMGETLLAMRKTDFMDLDQEEARTVMDTAIKAYQDSLREAFKNHAPPF